MQEHLSPEQRQSAAWDDVLIAHNNLDYATYVLLHTVTTLSLFAALDTVRTRHDELRAAQKKYRNALAVAE